MTARPRISTQASGAAAAPAVEPALAAAPAVLLVTAEAVVIDKPAGVTTEAVVAWLQGWAGAGHPVPGYAVQVSGVTDCSVLVH
jgi:hypothetical protein